MAKASGRVIAGALAVPAALAILLTFGGTARAEDAAPDPWPGLVGDIFANKPIDSGEASIALAAPARAEDAAIVPMTLSLRQPASDIAKMTLVIDQNPAPMAASFTIGPKSGLTSIAVRVRVNDFTNVHLVAQSADGSLHSVVRYVKAAGGCSAPSVKNMDDAADIGKMKFRTIASGDLGDARRREAQIMIRHPNNSGLQMDQSTNLYIPARYIDRLDVSQGGDLIFRMEGGISISEDPNFRFTYVPNGAKSLHIEAHDSSGKSWSADYPADGAS